MQVLLSAPCESRTLILIVCQRAEESYHNLHTFQCVRMLLLCSLVLHGVFEILEISVHGCHGKKYCLNDKHVVCLYVQMMQRN